MARRRHRFDPSIVREDGLHGVFGETLSLADAQALGRAFGTAIRRRAGTRVALAFDGRLSSPDLATAATAGLRAAGITVLRVGRGPLPMLCFATRHLAADGAVMVTGSHRPADHNGLKLIIGQGVCRPFEIERLVEIAAAGEFASGSGACLETPTLPAYLQHLLDRPRLADPVKVAWDPGHGATGELVAALARHLPGEHILINEVIDGSFPSHRPDPADPGTHAQLSRLVREERCDLGLALDGDGDQIAVFDESGCCLRPDLVMVLLARDILGRQGSTSILVDVWSSELLVGEIDRHGGAAVFCGASPAALIETMTRTGAAMAGRLDGRYLFAELRSCHGDALLAALRLLAIVSAMKQTVGQFRASLPDYVRALSIEVPAAPAPRLELIAGLKRMRPDGLAATPPDCIRVTTGDGWWAVESSRRPRALLAGLEARDSRGLSRVKADLARRLLEIGLAVPSALAMAPGSRPRARRAARAGE